MFPSTLWRVLSVRRLWCHSLSISLLWLWLIKQKKPPNISPVSPCENVFSLWRKRKNWETTWGFTRQFMLVFEVCKWKCTCRKMTQIYTCGAVEEPFFLSWRQKCFYLFQIATLRNPAVISSSWMHLAASLISLQELRIALCSLDAIDAHFRTVSCLKQFWCCTPNRISCGKNLKNKIKKSTKWGRAQFPMQDSKAFRVWWRKLNIRYLPNLIWSGLVPQIQFKFGYCVSVNRGKAARGSGKDGRICHCITKHCDDCRLTQFFLRLCCSKSSHEILIKPFWSPKLKGADVHFTSFLGLWSSHF